MIALGIYLGAAVTVRLMFCTEKHDPEFAYTRYALFWPWCAVVMVSVLLKKGPPDAE